MALATVCSPLLAEPVTLTSLDGTLSISGELLSAENDIYVIDTTLGSWSIAFEGVICEGEACPVIDLGTNIFIAGSSTIGTGLMPLLLAGFADSKGAGTEQLESDAEDTIITSLIEEDGYGELIADVSITSTNSSAAFLALLDPLVQIGMSTRRVEPAEARRINRAGGGDIISQEQEHVVAVDSVVVIVNQDNPINEISLADLSQIYSGRLTNWSSLGGANAPIIVYGRESQTSISALFEGTIFASTGGRRGAGIEVVASDEAMANLVNQDANAIGFVGYAFQRGAKPLDIVGECGLSASPEPFTSKAEEYPLDRRLYLYNRADNIEESSQELLDFATSVAADGVISKAGFISLSVSQDTRQFQGNRAIDLIQNTIIPAEIDLMREMVVEILQYDRLSTTFRFAAGSSSLETKAIIDLERLIEYLNQLSGDVEIAFIGFSDSDGSFVANRALSVNRARQVAAEVAAYTAGRISDSVTFTANGFGELSPVACDDSLEGKRTNRRVEVWIRRQ